MTQPRILVIEDQTSIADLVATALRYEGFETETANRGDDGLRLIKSFAPTLVILDVLLPDINGFQLKQQLTEENIDIPVLFLTALDATHDKIHGLSIGGDDYVTKPFSLEELIARVQAILRRTKQFSQGDVHLRFADLELSESTHEVWRQGKPIELTATEFSLLRYFLLNPKRVLSKTQILRYVWNYEAGDPNVVETYVSYLRRKIDCFEPHLIHTVRGIGYILRQPKAET